MTLVGRGGASATIRTPMLDPAANSKRSSFADGSEALIEPIESSKQLGGYALDCELARDGGGAPWWVYRVWCPAPVTLLSSLTELGQLSFYPTSF
jgi:hypothetical protein